MGRAPLRFWLRLQLSVSHNSAKGCAEERAARKRGLRGREAWVRLARLVRPRPVLRKAAKQASSYKTRLASLRLLASNCNGSEGFGFGLDLVI